MLFQKISCGKIMYKHYTEKHLKTKYHTHVEARVCTNVASR
jgi:hypothetical protein